MINALPATAPRPDGPLALDLPLKSALARITHGISPAAVSGAMLDWWMHLLASPAKQLELSESAQRKLLRWWLYLQQSASGQCAPCVEPAEADKRFARDQWRQPPYHAMSQAFLLWEQWWREATIGVRGVARHDEAVTSFVVRQVADTFSPSNTVLGNPEVLERTLASGGLNLLLGAANWWRDAMAVATDGPPKDAEKFRPGAAVALTPGQVVYRNRLIELIQYESATASVHREPVLIVPSWIMKFYILDLSPANSLVKHLVEQGHTVFMISWRNPGSADRDLSLEDYASLGVFDALAAVQRVLPRTKIHAMGYCLGGTLLAMAAAALARDDPAPLATVSLLAAQVDFNDPGELGLFIDESQIAFLEDLMSERGYLDGRQMAGAFALINSKDLVWSKLVHEYLMGATTPLTDLRAWNADATRMPARMHSQYLRNLYLHNDLAEGRFALRGRPVALQDMHWPMYVVATERDHVSPWRSVYKIHLLTDAELRFVLTSGGHNVGIVNPVAGPAASRAAQFRHGERGAGQPYVDPQAWYEAAPLQQGSWWVDWQRWLAAHSSARVRPPPIGGRGAQRLKPLGAAPGRYVHEA
ncbi:MAG: alpha/beta fold hydrolase [Ideonella sp.]|nr:alpha/beta fold hydrolase [Ideonella sp.]MCC7455444.1 alpha/beta fold hydrolase [Nitrospira sp.]